MRIASLILGIVSLVLSLFFGAIAIVPAIIGLIIGIIDIVSKSKTNEKKGQSIAGIIMSSIAMVIVIIMVSIIIISGNNTNTGVTSTSGNVVKKVSVSAKNVEMKKVGITKSGDFVIKVTNNNDEAVCLSSINTIFKDSEGNFVLRKAAEQSFVCIPAKGITYVHNWGYKENYEQYPIYEFTCELANISDNFVYNGIDITSNDTGSQIAVALSNNSGKEIESSSVTVVYYNDGEIVGVETGYSNDKIENGQDAYINVRYAKDSRYKEVAFDKYEVYYTQASLMF